MSGTQNQMHQARSLRKFHESRNRVEFDPTNAEHLISLRKFLNTGNWGTVQFHSEFPSDLSVPETVFRKMADHALTQLGY